MKKFMNWLKQEESGQGMVEYGLIIGVVAVVLIASLFILRGDIADIFTGISDAMNPAAG
jgi:pilus assembly protein Flp/PilA